MNRNEILAVAIDHIKGHVDNKFSAKQTSDELVAAFVDLNGGSTKINPKTFYRGNELFELVQELIPVIIEEGINADTNPLFRELVEYRNIAAGDLNEFVVDGEAHFVVATAANGIQGVRRQRIAGGTTVAVPTETRIVRVYENLGRLLAGRIDFDKFVNGVAKAYKEYIADAAYAAINGLSGATPGLNSTYVVGGTPSEGDIVELIEHVEAATGKNAKIVGTKAALRKLNIAVSGEMYKDDMYKLGYMGMFNGTPCIRMNQAHKAGTDVFALNDSKAWVIAGDDKPVKVVTSGDGILIERDATMNADLTQEYVYATELGTGVICAEKLGIITF